MIARCSASTELDGAVRMPGYMTAPVKVILQSAAGYSVVQAEVVHENLFSHRFSLDLTLLAEGCSRLSTSSDSTVKPLDAERISIRADVWHWQIPVEVSRESLERFISSASEVRSGS